MMKKRVLLAAFALTFMLIGCGWPATTAAPPLTSEGLVSPTTIEALTEAGVADPSVSEKLYEQNLPLFDYDQQAPLDVEEVTSWREGNATWIDLTYASPKGGRVPATLIVPDGRGPFAGVIAMHGMPSNRQNAYGVGRLHADRGAVVILIDAPFARPENVNRPQGALTLSEQDREEQIQLIVDLRRAVDLLIARPDVDPDRLAYIGISYGGAMGGLLAGVEHRLQAYVLQVGDGGLVTHMTGEDDTEEYSEATLDQPSREQLHLWLAAMWPIEPIHFVGHAGPAALLFQNGTQDKLVPPDDGLRYQRAGSEPKETLWYDAGHGLPREAFRDQTTWLQSHIGAGRLFVLETNYRVSALVLDRLLSAWLLLTIASLVFPLWGLLRGRPAPRWVRLGWVLACAVFGPLGLLAYLLAFHRRGHLPAEPDATPPWKAALGTVVYSVAGNVLGWVLTAAVIFTFLPDASQVVIQAASYIVPLLLGLAAFRAPLLALRLGRYPTALRRSILAEVISVNLAFAGMVPVMTFTLERWFRSNVEVASPLFWAITSLGAIAGVLVAYPYNLWLVRRHPGSRPTWAAGERGTTQAEEAVTTPSLGNAWGALLLSLALLGGSVTLTVMFLA
jgi:dienelactone hydrolase